MSTNDCLEELLLHGQLNDNMILAGFYKRDWIWVEQTNRSHMAIGKTSKGSPGGDTVQVS